MKNAIFLHLQALIVWHEQLGREKISPVSLVKSAWKQDAVIRARIDEFRAHHRLQLASGIVASSVDTGRSNQSSVGNASTSSKSEPRVRQLIKQQKKKMFRMDRNAGRLSRYVIIVVECFPLYRCP